MKHLLAIAFITLLALGTGCAWISPTSETTSDGIKVHGHWTVTVSNPDGTVDAVHKFENALGTDAASFLTGILLSLKDDKNNFRILPTIRFEYEGSFGNTVGVPFTCEEDPTSYGYGWNPPHIEREATMGRDIYKSGSPITFTTVCTIMPFKGEAVIESVSSHMTLNYTGSYNSTMDVHNTVTSEVKSIASVEFTKRILDDPIPINNNQTLSFFISISFN